MQRCHSNGSGGKVWGLTTGRANRRWPKLQIAVDLPSVADSDYEDDQALLFDGVNDAVVSRAKAEELMLPVKLLRTGRVRLG